MNTTQGNGNWLKYFVLYKVFPSWPLLFLLLTYVPIGPFAGTNLALYACNTIGLALIFWQCLDRNLARSHKAYVTFLGVLFLLLTRAGYSAH